MKLFHNRSYLVWWVTRLNTTLLTVKQITPDVLTSPRKFIQVYVTRSNRSCVRSIHLKHVNYEPKYNIISKTDCIAITFYNVIWRNVTDI